MRCCVVREAARMARKTPENRNAWCRKRAYSPRNAWVGKYKICRGLARAALFPISALVAEIGAGQKNCKNSANFSALFKKQCKLSP